MKRAIVFLAQGFGVGRVPSAPGTAGSVVGLAWSAALLASGRWWVILGGTVVGIGASVWLCGAAEKILNARDPGSVVMDEIAAMPVCFLWLLWIWVQRAGGLPSAGELFATGHGWLRVAVVFALFRLFDVWKPWPVRQSQELPGGWGVTVDDLLAAVYVNAVMAVLLYVRVF